MAKNVVMVACKLPHGIILECGETKVELKGKNKAAIIGADYAINAVDEDFWTQWLSANMEFPAVTSGAIFVAKNAQDAAAIANEFKNRKTGFEPMSQTSNGVKPADKD